MIINRSRYVDHSWLNFLGRLLKAMVSFTHQRGNNKIINDGYSSGYPHFKKHNGKIFCTSCGVCELNCPTQAIKITLSNTIDLNSNPFSGPLPKKFEVNLEKCIQCAECTRSCPVDALGMLGGATENGWANLI